MSDCEVCGPEWGLCQANAGPLALCLIFKWGVLLWRIPYCMWWFLSTLCDLWLTHLNLSSLVSSFWVCSSSCLLLTCSSFTSLISTLIAWSLAYSWKKRQRHASERSNQAWGSQWRWTGLQLAAARLPIATALEALVSGEQASQWELSSSNSSSWFLLRFHTVHSLTSPEASNIKANPDFSCESWHCRLCSSDTQSNPPPPKKSQINKKHLGQISILGQIFTDASLKNLNTFTNRQKLDLTVKFRLQSWSLNVTLQKGTLTLFLC